MTSEFWAMIFGTLIVSVVYFIYHNIGLYLMKYMRPAKPSKPVAWIYAILFPGVSHKYPLSYWNLHGLNVQVNPVSIVIPLYIAFILLFSESIGDLNSRRIAFLGLLLFPYSLSIWRTTKLTGTLAHIQSLESILHKKDDHLDKVNTLKKEAWERFKKGDSEHHQEMRRLKKELDAINSQNRMLKEQIREANHAENRLQRDAAREERKRRSLELLDECVLQGCELGLDSNILMECDDDFFEHLKKNRIVVSKFVHQEWDKLKVHEDRNVQGKARRAMYRFEELQKEGNVRMIIKQWDPSFLKANALMDRPGDESIIADYLYEYKVNNRDIQAVSYDTGFRTSARGATLPVLDIQK